LIFRHLVVPRHHRYFQVLLLYNERYSRQFTHELTY
jgi:hypothetical protein